jgi:NADH:ubiquinone oxidoreductase subunit 6 (subunit J)
MFQKTQTIPGYFFQLIIGIYVVQIIYILSIISNGIEHGADKLNEQYALGKNLLKGFLLYFIVALIVTILFNMISGAVLGSTQI